MGSEMCIRDRILSPDRENKHYWKESNKELFKENSFRKVNFFTRKVVSDVKRK